MFKSYSAMTSTPKLSAACCRGCTRRQLCARFDGEILGSNLCLRLLDEVCAVLNRGLKLLLGVELEALIGLIAVPSGNRLSSSATALEF